MLGMNWNGDCGIVGFIKAKLNIQAESIIISNNTKFLKKCFQPNDSLRTDLSFLSSLLISSIFPPSLRTFLPPSFPASLLPSFLPFFLPSFFSSVSLPSFPPPSFPISFFCPCLLL
jgi:hypothetical protein